MVYAKKSLGQHFLKDEDVARNIVHTFLDHGSQEVVLEVGPGQGVLTKYLYAVNDINYLGVELDQRMIPVLSKQFPLWQAKFINEDILTFDLTKAGSNQINIIGNFPYNISSQILFRVFENKERVQQVLGMFQKEVAKRIVADSGNKEYGILSVLMQAFYSVSYLFDVAPNCFTPPPKVTSGVIRLIKKDHAPAIYNEEQFRKLVKSGFGQRRKTLRNSLQHMISHVPFTKDPVFDKRAEQLSVADWIVLANRIATIK
ncbi:MAG: ribosomal RNA small subunit methyltransferase A [Chitinophagaceae bacterium]|nr:ribosomal RNA small subunit methyltransferase A [Chitinophagaceae bacterium]